MWIGTAVVFIVLFEAIKGQQSGNCDESSCDFGAVCKTVSENVRRCSCPVLPCEENEMVVCSVDDVTFPSICKLQQLMCETQRFIEIQHMGACGAQACTSKWDCLFDGECVGGECVCVECRDVVDRKVYYQGGSADVPGASRAWKRTSVCGSDGVTYESECHMAYHACAARRLVVMTKRGVCNHDRRQYVKKNSLPTVNVVQRSVIHKRVLNCSVVEFSHCVSKYHPRLPYMGKFVQIPGKVHSGSPVFQLSLQGENEATISTRSVGYAPISTLRREEGDLPIYLSRSISHRYPNGSWIIGSEIGSGRGWLGSADPTRTPQSITTVWKSSTTTRPRKWVKEPSMSMHCYSNSEDSHECTRSYAFDGPEDSIWQPVEPPTPYYILKVNQVTRQRNKRRPIRKITVEIIAKRKTRRFIAYILKLSTDRTSCGLPALLGAKNQRRHVQKCKGGVIMNKTKTKKLMKSKLRFKAPQYGCVHFSATVLSAQGYVYEDDFLVKRACAESL